MILSAAVLATVLTWGQTAPPIQPAEQEPSPSELAEVVVEAQRTREAAEVFVRAVAAPVRDRKAAVWRGSVCVGVGGMQPEPARYMADRISDWAASVGLSIEAPGCTPDIFVAASADGDATARELVRSRPREFRTGTSGADRGAAALEAFQSSGRPIRWWHISLPVNADTGAPMVRLPRQQPFTANAITRPSDVGPLGFVASSSFLTDESRDELQQAIIVLDTSALEQADFAQVTDYIAMVALAQVDPEARPTSPSILNLFEPGVAQEEALTRWDRAYLKALYGTDQRYSGGANLSAIADGVALEIARDRQATDSPAD